MYSLPSGVGQVRASAGKCGESGASTGQERIRWSAPVLAEAPCAAFPNSTQDLEVVGDGRFDLAIPSCGVSARLPVDAMLKTATCMGSFPPLFYLSPMLVLMVTGLSVKGADTRVRQYASRPLRRGREKKKPTEEWLRPSGLLTYGTIYGCLLRNMILPTRVAATTYRTWAEAGDPLLRAQDTIADQAG